jgi:hypothetical protein
MCPAIHELAHIVAELVDGYVVKGTVEGIFLRHSAGIGPSTLAQGGLLNLRRNSRGNLYWVRDILDSGRVVL